MNNNTYKKVCEVIANILIGKLSDKIDFFTNKEGHLNIAKLGSNLYNEVIDTLGKF